MRKLKHNLSRVARKDRGAALILVVIVIMVLTTLGMAMVAFSTTEEKTAQTYRDTSQTRALAEAGVRVVQEMFRDPLNSKLVPVYSATASADDTATPKTYHFWGTSDTGNIETNLNRIGIWRRDRTGANPARYVGRSYRFFVGPFQDSWGQLFGGTYSSTNGSNRFDVKFNCTNPDNASSVVASSSCWLDSQINSLLVGAGTASDWNLDPGKITDISFYAPPSIAGNAYGITTVRVTAEKWSNGNLLSREVVEALIGDGNIEPSVFADGNISMSSIDLCGDGCEKIHANGNASVGSVSAGAGENPVVTATGTASGAGGGSAADSGAAKVQPPEINPWDLSYRPTTSAGRAKYYLLAARALDAVWTDNNAATYGSAPEPCGVNQLALCQDYNLEYNTASPRVAKTAKADTDVPAMYRYNDIGPYGEWTLCTTGNSLNCGSGTPSFSVTPANDAPDPDATDTATPTRTDNADMPFNKYRVAQTVFAIGNKQDYATVLVDGKFDKSGSGGLDPIMSVVAVGSITLSSNSDWWPALENKAQFITGRDFDTHSNCCTNSNSCGNINSGAVGITAAHEQYHAHSNHVDWGLLIIENRLNIDTTVNNNTLAIEGSNNGSHGSLCYDPGWPWTMPTVPVILSLKSVAD